MWDTRTDARACRETTKCWHSLGPAGVTVVIVKDELMTKHAHSGEMASEPLSREDALDYADKHDIAVTASRTKIYSRDRNLWHISHEGGELESPANAPPEDVWMMTTDPKDAPDTPAELSIGFVAGVPVSVDGVEMAPVALLERLNELGSAHGVGRIDICENRLVGMKSRGVYETPGGTIIFEAARSLRALTMERDTMRLCEKLMPDYTDLVYTGRWFHPARTAMDALFADATKHVTGDVTVRLFKGTATYFRLGIPPIDRHWNYCL